MKTSFAAALAIAALAAAPVQGRIIEIRIDRVQPFADGMKFGETGAYERVVGAAKGELDPADPRNKAIVNLEKAPKNTRGRVEYETDFYILRPVDPSRASGKLLYEVTNRGRKFLFQRFTDAPVQGGGADNDPATEKDIGDTLLLRRGYVIAWSGWDPDAPRSGNGMAMTSPVATDGGRIIVRTIREELVSGTRARPVDNFRLSYEAATFDPSQARFTLRRNEFDPKINIPAAQWAYVDSRTIKLLPEGSKPEPGSLYELHYPAKDPKVLGIGFAATRDFVSFLRYEAGDDHFTPNPAHRVHNAFAVGISQSGRYLRDHVAQGFNQDEGGRKVFDGVLTHTAGIGRVFLNAEFGEPSRTNTQHEDHFYPENEFPFSTARLKDPVSGKTGELFRGDGFDPLLIEVNTSTEYWQKGASLLHTDPLGKRDVKLPANARAFMIAGTQHAGRAGLTTDSGQCANPRNPHNPAPALRALLVALDEWVTQGKAPPPSRVPALAGGTLVAHGKTGFPEVPGVQIANRGNSLVLFDDWINPIADPAKAYRPLVPKVDKDGNEVAGVRLPDISVPLAAYTGWNLYKSPFPEGELCDRDGSYIAFARTRAEREAKGDPRPSLEERYDSQHDYVQRVQKSATDLVRARLLLREDADAYIQAATNRSLFQ